VAAALEITGGSLQVGQIAFRVATPSEAVASTLRQALGDERPQSIRLANAYCVALAESDSMYRQLLRKGVVYPDGTPVMWAMRWHGAADAFRVRGPDFFENVLAAGVGPGIRHFFLGATSETLAALTAEVARRYPGIEVAGTYAPPFAPVDRAFIRTCVERVVASGATMVWVGLGTPKQDYVSTAINEQLGLPAAGVGAAFDFVAGTARQAPLWMQRSGLEWFFRLCTEPRRLWRRYLIGNVQFVAAVLRHRPHGRI
jgi:N-acetylglucosaminyldiphosphoundecaprenol N-acetyl-beta-D-mannosaminyltransferase